MPRTAVSALAIAVLVAPLASQRPSKKPEETPTIAAKTAKMRKHDGFLPLYWDAGDEKLWLEVERWGEEFLHAISTASAVAGRDRGGWGGQRVLRFERVGSKVFLIEPNYSYRAVSDDPLERRAVAEAYTDTTVAGFVVRAEEDGRVLVDATDFFMSEGARGRVDKARSAIYWARTAGFPKNTEVEVTLTTSGGGGGSEAPSPRLRGGRGGGGAATVRLHHSFVELPPAGYRPRRYDPRAGVSSVSFMDYASPIDEPIRKRYITRHRLEKKDPSAAISAAVEPIVYYVDPGAPEPIRAALVEGASWWNQAFEAIGYRDAFQVKVLPADADPMDLRYNMILWTHRPDRGWSMGTSVRDPRTGEIITGRVFLGSQRVRQDYLIGAGLLAAHGEQDGVSEAILRDIVLARTRQLAAHEVGHTLGFGHNFAASTRDRGSVMDYPHPYVKIAEDGTLDLSDAYDDKIGEWDKVFVAYAYSDFPDDVDEDAALDGILRAAHERDLFFLGTVGSGSASPLTHQWDNGPDALAELARVMKIREIALKNFSEANVPEGAQLSALEEVLVPLYLFHRYQTEAVSKSLGGVDYRFAARGDGQRPVQIVDTRTQMRALDALLGTIRPEVLALPESVLTMIPPRAGFGGEVFPRRTSPTFDPLAAAETAANHSVGFIFNRNRAARLVTHHALDSRYPSLGGVIDRVLESTWKASRGGSSYHAELGRVVDNAVLHNLMALAASGNASTQVRAIANLKLDDLAQWLLDRLHRGLPEDQRAHFAFAKQRIYHFSQDPTKFTSPTPVETPAGAPIGMGEVSIPGMICDWR